MDGAIRRHETQNGHSNCRNTEKRQIAKSFNVRDTDAHRHQQAARRAAQRGEWRRAARLQRASLEYQRQVDAENSRPQDCQPDQAPRTVRGRGKDRERHWELRTRYRLLRWSCLAGDWSDVLDEVDRIYELVSELDGRLDGALDWLAFVQCVARFESGWGDRFRRSLARILIRARKTRRSRDSTVTALAFELHRTYRAARSSAVRDVAVSNGPLASIRTVFRDPRIRRGYSKWIRSVSLFGWEDTSSSLLASAATDESEFSRLWDCLLAQLGRGGSVPTSKPPSKSAKSQAVSTWSSADEVRTLRSILAAAVEATEVDGGDARRRLLDTASTPHRPCLIRALALRVAAELGVSGLSADDPLRMRHLARFRNELGMAAGLFHGLGLHRPAAECEERWASLHPSLSRLPVAHGGEPFDRRLTGTRTPRSLEDVRARCLLAGFRTGDAATLRSCARLLLLAPTPLPVLIRGESGTGKEVMARALHEWSGVDGEFVAIHCGAIPRELLESELFGHSRGAFTGAAADKPGLIEVADGGTLFLDEIGEMSAEAQMKLLRVLESGEVRRVGDVRTRKVRVRIVAATHRDLESAVELGEFRLDLLHRIGSVVVVIPPLRSRRGDIPLLVRALLEKVGPGLGLTEAALGAVFTHEWPGNVRELRATVLRAAYLARALGTAVITEDLLGLEGTDAEVGELAFPAVEPEDETESSEPSCETVESMGLDQVLESLERRLIVRALQHSDWNRAQAARSLGGLSRTTLVSKMKRLGIVKTSEPCPTELNSAAKQTPPGRNPHGLVAADLNPAGLEDGGGLAPTG